MMFEDQVLGVLVLSKLGLNQFSDDDLRLLVIYASFAAQAMANADTTERLREQSAALERQLRQPARAPADHRVDPDHTDRQAHAGDHRTCARPGTPSPDKRRGRGPLRANPKSVTLTTFG